MRAEEPLLKDIAIQIVLTTWLLGVRCDLALDNLQLRLAYTKVADKADIIAPWRGFPTAGFTRAMSQYNWYANTKSYMVQANLQCGVF